MDGRGCGGRTSARYGHVSDEEEAYSTCDLLSLWMREDSCVGVCATCYTLKRQDEEYFGGHRETVLARDSHLCRIPGCTSIKRGKQSLAVHHRVPGNNNPDLMITLCLGHHAMVTRTQMLRKEWPELLRVLWREQHPEGHEQTTLNFAVKPVAVKRVPLFPEDRMVRQ
jgi:hypothetical protein